jgi:hypothetical protein
MDTALAVNGDIVRLQTRPQGSCFDPVDNFMVSMKVL